MRHRLMALSGVMLLLAAAIAIRATVLVMDMQDRGMLQPVLRDSTFVHRKWSAGGGVECVCKPLLPPIKQEGGGREKCDPRDIRPGAVMHCMTGQGKGYFEVQPDPGIDHLGGFVRINGGVIDTSVFQPRYHHEDGPTKKRVSWRSSYSICRPGNYSGAVYVYTQGRGAENILTNTNSCLVNKYLEHPALFFWEERSFAPRCSSLWYWDGESRANSNSSDLSVISQFARRNFSLIYSDLRTSLPVFDFARNNTLTGNQTHEATTKDVCLFGDSHTRHLHNSIASKLGQGLPCNRLGKQKCNARGLTWRWLRWGVEEEMMRLERSIANCSHVFVNYGQWSFGYTSRPTPWTYERYRRSLKRNLEILLKMQNRQPGLKITWLSTSPHPPDWRQTDCPMVDWRVPHIIQDINLMAWELVQTTSGRISFLDIFGIIFPVFDLSFDRNHYQDMVGDAVANALAHCVHGSCFRGNQLDLGQNRGSGPV